MPETLTTEASLHPQNSKHFGKTQAHIDRVTLFTYYFPKWNIDKIMNILNTISLKYQKKYNLQDIRAKLIQKRTGTGQYNSRVSKSTYKLNNSKRNSSI